MEGGGGANPEIKSENHHTVVNRTKTLRKVVKKAWKLISYDVIGCDGIAINAHPRLEEHNNNKNKDV